MLPHTLVKLSQVIVPVHLNVKEDTPLPLAGHEVGKLLRIKSLLVLQLGHLVRLEPHVGREDKARLDEGPLLRLRGGALTRQPAHVAPVLLLLAADVENLCAVMRIVEAAVLVEDESYPAGAGPVRVPQRSCGMQLVLGYLKSPKNFRI
jgi:hypothetical protein